MLEKNGPLMARVDVGEVVRNLLAQCAKLIEPWALQMRQRIKMAHK